MWDCSAANHILARARESQELDDRASAYVRKSARTSCSACECRFCHRCGLRCGSIHCTCRCSFVTLDPWGESPFLFFPALSPVFSIFSSSISCPRVSLFLPPHPYHPCLRFLRHFTLFFFTFVKSHNVLCLVLSSLTSPVTMCLCVGL